MYYSFSRFQCYWLEMMALFTQLDLRLLIPQNLGPDNMSGKWTELYKAASQVQILHHPILQVHYNVIDNIICSYNGLFYLGLFMTESIMWLMSRDSTSVSCDLTSMSSDSTSMSCDSTSMSGDLTKVFSDLTFCYVTCPQCHVTWFQCHIIWLECHMTPHFKW